MATTHPTIPPTIPDAMWYKEILAADGRPCRQKTCADCGSVAADSGFSGERLASSPNWT